MSGMFYQSYDFNQPIGSWDVSNVINMAGVFMRSNFNQPLDSWDVSNVTEMWSMFRESTNYNQDLNSWSVNGVTNCTLFSDGATSWTLPQPNFTNCNPN